MGAHSRKCKDRRKAGYNENLSAASPPGANIVMDLFEAAAKRHSYRGPFADVHVPRADLQKIVQAGIQAPSACNEQTTSFVMIDDPELLRRVAAIVARPVCETARAMIACVADPRPVYEGLSFASEDCAAAVENMLLAITALGYATVWLDGVLRRENKAARLGELLGVPPNKTIRVLLPLGVPAQPGQQKEKLPLGQRAWFNRYGANG
jgi:nitroreductase